MITARACVARMNPIDGLPAESVCPGPAASGPNRNRCPSIAASRKLTTTSLSHRNSPLLGGAPNTTSARIN